MLFLFFSASFAQQLTNNNPIKTIYYYSFNAVMDASIIDEMEKEVQLLTSVIEVKIKYKPENKTAQLIVLVKERRRNSEGDLLFQPTDLKHIISAHGFLPNELTTEVLLD
ncbi:MAG: hypothetical protein COX70_02655 [Flavobacteriales bacterium CG_4_10_14_0_2_um_filter_32_8]|nr:MAG: hypothetical protein COX70_02655 [Flavobacteriales bacterium CG_4_10_14_0_2_um_filter_32_8]PJB13945.1 MAG: hypothetical protein CO118_11190 [Flavobacteriales bacterium CG_4_9_14_3_um_filter_32_8]